MLPRHLTALALASAALWAAPVHASAPTGGGATPAPTGQAVRLRDHPIAELAVPLDGVAPQERARRATGAIAAAFDAGARAASVRAEGDRAVVLLGDRPVLALGADDAAAAGLPDAAAVGAQVAAGLQRAAREEGRRLAARDAVFSFSMLVFSGLIALLLARRAGALARALAARIEAGEAALPALEVGGVEVASAGFLRGAIPLALRLGRFVVQAAVAYAWLLFAASLFEDTRPLGGRLSRALVEPAARVVGAVGRALPLAVAALLGAAVLGVVLRAMRLWFEAVERGDVPSRWVPRELARPTGALVRGAVAGLALLAAPGLLGMGERGLGGLGWAALLALGLGASPLAATLVMGAVAVYGRGLRPGDVAEVAGHRGRVREVTLREIVLDDEGGGVVRVPHLLTLVHPMRLERRP